MKKVIFAIATILTIGFMSSCSKEANTNPNQQAIYLSAQQMLLLGTTNPSDANAASTWYLDSTTYTSGAGEHIVSIADAGDLLKFTSDSLTNTIPGGSYTYSYTITNDTIKLADNSLFCIVVNVDNQNLHVLNPDNKDVFYHKQ